MFQYLQCTGSGAVPAATSTTWRQSRCHGMWYKRPGQTTVGSRRVVFVSKVGPAWGHELWCGLWSQTLCVCAQSLSHVQLFVTPWTVARQALPPMGFCRQEYWSELPFPPPEDLPNPGIELASPALRADSLLTELPRKSDLKTCKDEMLPPQGLRMLQCVWKEQRV